MSEKREEARRLAARLAHDVGKYVARTARNLGGGALGAPLVAMLQRDLYATEGSERASAVFARLAEPLRALVRDPRLRDAGCLLDEIDALEGAVALADETAVARAASAARAVEMLLRDLARDLADDMADIDIDGGDIDKDDIARDEIAEIDGVKDDTGGGGV